MTSILKIPWLKRYWSRDMLFEISRIYRWAFHDVFIEQVQDCIHIVFSGSRDIFRVKDGRIVFVCTEVDRM
jgi:hypothetical protein